MKNVLINNFWIILLFFSLKLVAQKDSLEISCQKYYEQKTTAEVEEFKQLRKYKFLRFLPSFGYSLQRADFIVAINTNGIISYMEDRQIRDNKVNSIILTNKLLLEEDLRNITLLKKDLQELEKQKNVLQEILEIDQKIFEIKQTQYKQAELEPLQFLQAKKSFIQQQQQVENINYQLFLKKQALLNTAKWNF